MIKIGSICCWLIGLGISAFCQEATQDTTFVKSITATPSATSISTLQDNHFNKGVTHSPYQLLNGRLTGLGMSSLGNDPNGEFQLRVRGLSTLQNETRPLLVVDGFITNNFLIVDPSDIAQITLLKDAAATSIYGVQGANGVILISTKNGKDQVPSISFNTMMGLEQPISRIQPASAMEFKRQPGSTDLGSSTDWLDLITRNGISTINNLAISGGSKSFSITASVNHRKGSGTLIGTGFSQLNSRLNIQQKAMNDKLHVQLTVATTSRKSDYGFREAIKYAFTANPTMPVFDPASTLHGGYSQNFKFDNYNPLAIIQQNTNTGNEQTSSIGINSDYQFDGRLKGLNAQFSYQLQNQNNLFGRYYSKNSYFVGELRKGLASRNSEQHNTQQLATTLSYNKKWKAFDIQLSSGYRYQEYFKESFFLEGGNFLTDAFTYNNMSAAQDFPNGVGVAASLADSYKVISWLNTASITFKNKYFLNVTNNSSGSTRLGTNNKWGLFPSIGGGVQWKKGIPVFSLLKLRASWGKAGNIPQQSNLSGSLLSQGGFIFYNGNYIPSYYNLRSANPNLKWEEKTEFNFGTDFTFLNERISGSIDWFNNKVTDLISEVRVPSPPNLGPAKFANLGELKNHGVEINLNVSAIKRSELIWDFNFYLSRVSTKVKSLSGNGYSLIPEGKIIIGNFSGPGSSGYGANLIQEGAALGQIYGAVYDGIDQNGAGTVKDLDGNGIGCYCEGDFKVIGNALPKFNFGWGNQLSYKNIDLRFLFRGAVGHHIINSYRLFHESAYAAISSNLVKTSYFNSQLQYANFSSLYVEKASFIKLDNISLMFHIPSAWEIVITATAQNLFTLTKYTGMNPEVAYEDPTLKGQTTFRFNRSPLISGIEMRGNYLPSRIFSLGISLKL